MRKLMLLRHAKAEIGSLAIPDLDRQLIARGRKAAARMAHYLASEALIPDYVISSSSARTRETLSIMQPMLRPDGVPDAAIAYEPLIYEAPYERILHVIHRAPNNANLLMVVGHNPGLEDLVDALMMTADKDAEQKLRAKFPTCALAVLTFPALLWEDVAEQTGHLERFITPRALAD